jgi:hypothetical protein
VVGDDGVGAAAACDVPSVAVADPCSEGAFDEAPGEALIEEGEDLGRRVEGCGVGAYVEGCDAAGAGAEDGGAAAGAGALADTVTV